MRVLCVTVLSRFSGEYTAPGSMDGHFMTFGAGISPSLLSEAVTLQQKKRHVSPGSIALSC